MRLGLGGTVARLAVRPVLLWEALRAFIGMRAHGGLRPSSGYLRWRAHTAYGDGMSGIRHDDLVTFLRWRRRMRALR